MPGRLHASRRRHPPRRVDPRGARAGPPRRLLVVLSDGFAYDHGYEGALRRGRRPAGPRRGPAARASGASASASAPTPSPRRCGGCSAPPPTPPCPRADQLPDADRAAVPRRAAARPRRSGARSNARSGRASAWRSTRRTAMSDTARARTTCPVGDEEQVFKAAFRQGLSVLLKGPTGCGKTRFVEAMAHDLGRPLITVSCHDDLTTADLVGRYLLEGGDTTWVDGPLTRAVREGAICYLDEIVEARQDTTVVHPPARPTTAASCPIDRLGVDPRRRAGLLPRRVLQPRLPERAQGPEGLDPPAHGRHRARLPAARRRGEDRRATRPASTTSDAARLVQLGQAIRRLEHRRPARGGLDPRADRGRPARRPRACRSATAARAAVAGPLTDDPVGAAPACVEMIDAYLADDATGSVAGTRLGSDAEGERGLREHAPSRSSSATCSTSSCPTASRRRCATT